MTFDALKILIFSLVCKKKTKQNKKQDKEKEKNYSIAIILQKNHLCKKPRSVIYSVSQSVSKTDYQSIFRLAAKLGTHIASQWNSQSVVLVIGQHAFSQLVK